MRNLRDLKSRYEFQLDNKQLVLLFAGMVVILILAFILGTLFGKNLYSMKTGEEAAPALAEPAPEAPAPLAAGTAEPETGPVAIASPEEQEKQKLMKELEAQKLPSAPPAPAAPAPSAKTETASKPEPAAEPMPAPVSGAGPYTIQLAASPNRPEAEALKGKLLEKKYDAYLVKVEIPGKGLWYRVRVGHYQSREQADKALRIIKAREPQYQDAFVTK